MIINNVISLRGKNSCSVHNYSSFLYEVDSRFSSGKLPDQVKSSRLQDLKIRLQPNLRCRISDGSQLLLLQVFPMIYLNLKTLVHQGFWGHCGLQDWLPTV